MKKSYVFTIVLLLGIVTFLSGCDRLVKNPRTISVKTDKGVATITYDDNRQYQLNGLANNYFLQNNALNFSMFIGNYTGKKEEQDKLKKEFKEDKDFKYLEKVKINKYNGFGRINKKTGATDLYIYLDKKDNIVLCIKINATDVKKIKKTHKKPENMVYNKEEIKEILSTLKYKEK